MAKDKNLIFWIIGIVVVGVIVLSQSGGNLGLFSTAPPLTCEDYGYYTTALPDMRNWEEIDLYKEGVGGKGLICWYVVGETDQKDLCESTGGVWMPQPGGGMECECPSEQGLDRDYYGHFNSIKGCILCEIMMFPTVMPTEGYMYVSDYNEDGCVIGRHEELIPKRETVCCKLSGLPGKPINYQWSTTSECKTPEDITDIYNVIVDDSYCEAQEKWYNQELFLIGNFIVKLWMVLLGLGAILLIYISRRK